MRFCLSAGFLAALVASATPALAGDAVTRTFALQDFSAIEISGAYELNVKVGGDYSVAITGREADLARAEASVRGGALVLATTKRLQRDKDHDGRDSLSATVTMPALDALKVAGVVDADISGVDAGAFEVNLSGVGEVNIAGRCKRFEARVSGVGELNAKPLECADVDIVLSGMGEASIYARDSVKAEVSGMGEINIYGSPKTVDKRGGFFSEISVH